MAVFASTTTVAGQPLSQIIGTDALPEKEWEEMKTRVIQGGKNIIDLRGRSSFQSPSFLSIEMVAAAMGGPSFTWPVGTYVCLLYTSVGALGFAKILADILADILPLHRRELLQRFFVGAGHLGKGHGAVSYTHLDVYKRQGRWFVATRQCGPR